MDNFNLRKYLAEGRLFEQEYPELISFLNANVEDVKQHMRDYFLDDEEEVIASMHPKVSSKLERVEILENGEEKTTLIWTNKKGGE